MSNRSALTNKIWFLNIKTGLRAFILLWEAPQWSLAFALVIYAALAWQRSPIWSASYSAYYNYLADAFLHGQLNLRVIPEITHDLVVFNQQYYLYWPPMPAILLIPFVALFGIGFSDILFTIVIGAINVALISLLLRQITALGLVRLSRIQRALLVLFFALGTVHVTLAPYGDVWFTGQLVGFLFMALAYLSGLHLKGWLAFFLTGVNLTCAMLTRNPLLFIGIWPAVYLLVKNKNIGFRKLVAFSAIGILPVMAGLGLIAWYNWARFGNVLDIGYAYHHMAYIFADDFNKYGPFNLHYVPTNIYYQYINYPLPLRSDSLMGGSLFLLSPVFFLAFIGLKNGRPRWSVWALVATIMVVNIPILLLMGTGWVQFGPRYTLDFTIPLLILTAYGVRKISNQGLAILTVISVIQYIYGTLVLSIVLQ